MAAEGVTPREQQVRRAGMMKRLVGGLIALAFMLAAACGSSNNNANTRPAFNPGTPPPPPPLPTRPLTPRAGTGTPAIRLVSPTPTAQPR
ncbi:MAG: hypothetical protein ACYDCQ_00320 [Dehalococcoidia bacterium]